MTSIPVGDFVFDHGRSCAEARSCPLTSTPFSTSPSPQPPTPPSSQGPEPDASGRTTHRQNNHLPRRLRPFLPAPARPDVVRLRQGFSSLRKMPEQRNSSEDYRFATLTSPLLACALECKSALRAEESRFRDIIRPKKARLREDPSCTRDGRCSLYICKVNGRDVTPTIHSRSYKVAFVESRRDYARRSVTPIFIEILPREENSGLIRIYLPLFLQQNPRGA